MLKNLKIGYRIAAGFGVVLVLAVSLIIPFSLSKIEAVVAEAEHRELRGLFENVKAAIAAEGRLAEAMSALVANIPDVQTAMANGDRNTLGKLLVPPFKVLKKEYGARQFQFHTPPATSFFRVHKPQKFGDDLSSFRKTVIATNEKVKPVQGIEKGVAGLGVRGMVPLRKDGQHLGSLEFGMSFGQPFFEQFKQNYGVDITLHVARDGQFKTFASTLGEKTLLGTDDLQQAFVGKKTLKQAELGNVPVAVFGGTVNDFSGKPIGVLEIVMDRSEYANAIASARNIMLIIGLVSLAIGFAIAWFITRGIVRPINDAVTAMKDIAEGGGDLTRRLDEHGKDEIAELGSAFNRFAEKMRIMVKDVAGSTSQLAESSAALQDVTEATTGGVDRQRAEINQVATAMTEMTATVQEVARHASEAATAATDADQEANSGRQVVAQTISSINALAQEVERASEAINRLEQDSEGIGTVLDVIKGIAEQTNLLALNAAIEAARAGEQGRGFAVVADEVRTLASRTQQSTQEIQEMIERLQTGARDAVGVMSSGRSQAAESVEQAQKAGHSLDEITNAVKTISEMNTQIATAAEEQSAVAEEINQNVININEVAEDVSQRANDTARSSNELADLAGQLEGMVNQFKV